jgi:CubicO group peptidase (beta-lactamase class C family)
MTGKLRKLIALVALVSVAANALGKEPGSPVRKQMQAFVDRKVISGAVTIVATKDKLLQLETVGYADLAKREAMHDDHLFWIASMTKPLAGVCVLMLQEEGKLSVEDAVEKHLPEFKGQWMVRERSKGRLVLEP